MRTNIGIDAKIAHELREFVERKYGFVHGTMKRVAEAAISAYIKE